MCYKKMYRTILIITHSFIWQYFYNLYNVRAANLLKSEQKKGLHLVLFDFFCRAWKCNPKIFLLCFLTMFKLNAWQAGFSSEAVVCRHWLKSNWSSLYSLILDQQLVPEHILRTFLASQNRKHIIVLKKKKKLKCFEKSKTSSHKQWWL